MWYKVGGKLNTPKTKNTEIKKATQVEIEIITKTTQSQNDNTKNPVFRIEKSN
jgi:hypothetical protein